MKRLISLTVVVMMLVTAGFASSFPTDGFRINFPREPELSKRSVPTDAGSFELRSYIVDEDTVAFFVGVCDYGDAVNGKDRSTILQGAQDGALKNSNSHLLSSKPITLQGYPGLAFEAESDAAHFSVRIYFVGTTLYQTLVVSPKGKVYSSDAFLSSFEFIPRTR